MPARACGCGCGCAWFSLVVLGSVVEPSGGTGILETAELVRRQDQGLTVPSLDFDPVRRLVVGGSEAPGADDGDFGVVAVLGANGGFAAGNGEGFHGGVLAFGLWTCTFPAFGGAGICTFWQFLA